MTQSDRRGFTLIELIVALVLASLLTAALLRIVGTIALDNAQLRRERSDDLAAGLLADQLRIDLINARGMAFDDRTLLLSGFIGKSQLPATVRYAQRQVGKHSVLIRQANDQTLVCWVGFGRFVIVPQDEAEERVPGERLPGEPDPAEATPMPDVAGGLPPIAGRLQVGMLDASGRLLFSEVVHHHDD